MQRPIDYLLIITIAFSSVFCLYQSASAGSAEDNYLTYYNSRFAYSISYPANILFPQGESDNGDGQKFLSKDQRTMMVVYGQYEAKELGQTLKTLYIEESRGGTKDHAKRVVTYKTMKSAWFVVSGYEDGRVYYQKTMLKKEKGSSSLGVLKTFRIEYDETQKRIFDPITRRIASSFKG